MTTFRPSRRIAAALLVATLSTAATGQEAGADDLPDLEKIKQQIVEIRGLEFTEDVPAKEQSIEDFAAHIDAEMEGLFPEGRLDDMQAGLLRLGMIAEPIDILAELREAVLGQAGGYYDPETGTFYYLMADLGAEFLETIAAHELVHALQDQHYDLGKTVEELEQLMGELPRDDDALLATRFLIEGEATYVQTLWQLKHLMGMDLTENPQMAAQTLQMQASMDLEQLVKMMKDAMPDFGDEAGSIAEAIEQMDEIPAYILYPLYAAYMDGAYFAAKLRADHGWEGIAGAFAAYPESTEQALHPEKYKADRPTPIDLAPITKDLEADGWALIDAAIHGEYYLRLLLRNGGVSGGEAKRATSGWDGDVYQAWRKDERVAIVLATTWDGEHDAGEFADSFLAAREVKYANFERTAESDDLSRVEYTCGEGDATGILVRRGRDVLVVEGFDAKRSGPLMKALEAVEIAHVE